jgi:hypothetical protein
MAALALPLLWMSERMRSALMLPGYEEVSQLMKAISDCEMLLALASVVEKRAPSSCGRC